MIVSEDTEPSVHPFGIGEITPVAEDFRRRTQGQTAVHLMDFKGE